MKIIINLFFALFLISAATAQTYEIRTVHKGSGVIGIEMRETSGSSTPTTSDYVCDIVFGITWDTAYRVNLGSISTTFNISKAGSRSVQGTKYYQAFYANNTPFAFPADWTTGTWVEIASIPNTMDGISSDGTFEIAASGFNQTTEPNFNVNLVADYTPTIAGSASNVPLPVTLMQFEGKKAGEAVVLNWTTASSHNFSHFEIERSDESGKFVFIKSETGETESQVITHYQFIDFNPNKPVNYYRLKLVDLDGSYTYSKIIIVHFGSDEIAKINIYPNPVESEINIQSAEGYDHVYLYDANSVLTNDWDVSETIRMNQVASGTYFLVLTGNNRIFVKRITKI
ncbi:MAG: T9SS type A sorting domain-containing protein [Bacteroidetes bacterium]|nr:T9SS type A sorting domain-containing protein [Bacteroidota bacterium]